MQNQLLPIKTIENKIYIIRGHRVMLDSDLAELYEVETKVLNQAVKRNIDRFPEDFMFQLTEEEVVTNCDHVQKTSRRKGFRPYVFTEHGVLMLSSVLNSKRAVAVNVQIMRVFVKLRQLATTPVQEVSELKKLLLLYMEKTDARLEEHDQNFTQIIHVLNNLLENPKEPNKIGFITD
ncbi:MAG: hypothetical protein A2Y25_09305 [Candidatus Melainabacteria bacterium GWF2_37_15]|nr:MAG: hypothetical protein A2Y25_09305 [Candidatus Melainabacteria bacterium GWF2_37_15]